MIIYSVEILIKKELSKEWVEWMKKNHIPEVMNTKLFSKFKFYKNLESGNKCLYTIQYETGTLENYLRYNQEFSHKLQKSHANKFANKFSAKRNLFVKLDDLD